MSKKCEEESRPSEGRNRRVAKGASQEARAIAFGTPREIITFRFRLEPRHQPTRAEISKRDRCVLPPSRALDEPLRRFAHKQSEWCMRMIAERAAKVFGQPLQIFPGTRADI